MRCGLGRTIGQIRLVAQPRALYDLPLEVHALLCEGLALLRQVQELLVRHLQPARPQESAHIEQFLR